LAEIYTVCLHSSYTAEKWHVMCNENNVMQKFYHPLRMTDLFCEELQRQDTSESLNKWSEIPPGLSIPAKEISLRRPYGTPFQGGGISFPHAEARG